MPLTELESTVIERLARQGAAMEALLGELVGINSFTDDPEGVNAVGRVIEARCLEMGFRTSSVVTGVSGQHLVARTRADRGNRLLLLGHLDTVYPAGSEPSSMTEDPRDPTRLRGPGVTDMKGGLVVMTFAARALAEIGALDDHVLTMLFSADEETGSPTGHDIIAHEASEHHLCLVFETGSELADGATTFVTRRKGFGRLTVAIHGREAHAGAKKEEGLSAALEMAHKVVALEGMNDPARGRTVNVGVARAGTTANTVPGLAELEIDYRFENPDDLEVFTEELIEVSRTPTTGNEAFDLVPRIEIVEGPRCGPMPRTDAVERMAGRIRAWGGDLGLKLEEEARGGASDGNVAAEAGCPTVDGLGTVGGDIHTPNEWVRRASLVQRSQLLALTALRFYEL